MKRIENSLRNMLFGEVFQLINVAASFILRTAMVKTLGINISGLNSVFNEVVALLSMAELGVGTAITYHLYKPLADGDRQRLGQIMRLFKTAYRFVAAGIAVIGLLTLPFIQLIIKNTSLDVSYIRLVYALFIVRTSISYLFSYKATLLNADQKSYKVSRINCYFRLASSLVSIFIMLYFKNFLAYLVWEVVSTFLLNLFVSRAATKEYPFLIEPCEPLPKDDRNGILSNVKHVFVGSISGKITNSTDNVLISTLVDTATVGYYANYSLIITAIRNLINQASNATHGAIGNVMAKESNEKCDEVLRRLTFVLFLISAVAGTCLYCLLSHFVGDIWYDRSFTISSGVVFLLCVNFLLCVINDPLYQMVRTSNLFSRDKNISMLGSGVNLAVSLALGWKLGMLGIFIGTTCTYVIQITLKIRLLYARRFALSPKRFYIFFAEMTAAYITIMLLSGWVCSFVTLSNAWVSLIVKLLIAVALSGAISVALFCKTPEWRYVKWLLAQGKTRLKKRLGR